MDETPKPLAEDSQLEARLRAFRPTPSQRFYQRLEAAPWQAGRSRPDSVRPYPAGLQRPGWQAALALAAALLLFGLAAWPGLYVLGQQIWRFFTPEDEDRLVLTLDAPGVTRLEGPADFPLDPLEAAALAGFEPRVLANSPELVLSGLRYETQLQALQTLYTASGYTLLVTQRPLGTIQELASIGPAAQVIEVEVAGQAGEYVAGGWRQPPGTITPAGEREIETLWDANLPQQTLRWQEGGFAFELRCFGDRSPGKDGLLSLAERLK